MKPKFKRFLKVSAYIVVAFVLLQFGSYWAFSKTAKYYTVDRFIPKWTSFQFACISDNPSQDLTDKEKNAIRRTLSPHFETIYFGLDEVPEDLKSWALKDEVLDMLKGGCVLTFEVKKSGFMWFKGYYSDYVGNMAASGRDATLIWILGKWWFVSIGPSWVS